jgi:hypothetical protein
MMATTTHFTRIALSSVLLMLLLGKSQGRQPKNAGGVVGATSGVDIDIEFTVEDGMEEIEQELARLCIDDPYLKYLHFNANLGSTSFEDCTWVRDSPDERCELQSSNGGSHEIGRSTTPLPSLLRDICPFSCGLCPTNYINPETDIDRNGNVSTDDLTRKQIKELEIRIRRQKQNLKKKRKGRKPCPCPDGQDPNGQGHGGGGGNDTGVQSSPLEESPTQTPGTDASTSSPTSSITSTTSFEGSYTGSWTSSYTGSWTTSFTSSSTSSSTSTPADGGAIIGSVITGQQSSQNNNGITNRTKLIVALSVIPIVLLLLVCCCLIRRAKKIADKSDNNKSGGDDSDTDESDSRYPIHKTKSCDSEESRFAKVLGYFNGRQDDTRTDVHVCTSAVCETCNPRSPRRVMSLDSYQDEFAMSKVEEGERYRVKEVEC